MSQFKKIVAPLVACFSLAMAMPAFAAQLVTNGENTSFIGVANAGAFGAPLGPVMLSDGVSAFSLQDSSAYPSTYQAFGGFQSAVDSNAITLQSAFGQDPRSWNLDNVSVQTLSSVVPESTTWALLLFGFGVAGMSMRARSRRVTSFV